MASLSPLVRSPIFVLKLQLRHCFQPPKSKYSPIFTHNLHAEKCSKRTPILRGSARSIEFCGKIETRIGNTRLIWHTGYTAHTHTQTQKRVMRLCLYVDFGVLYSYTCVVLQPNHSVIYCYSPTFNNFLGGSIRNNSLFNQRHWTTASFSAFCWFYLSSISAT